ncbi:hypothetical protein EU99_1808 [Prochlorococcus marinus str. MIT 9321]|uniref:Sulfotransferase domain-containing protein n=1 Tax=Prochlorococcus marinus str. MIT 9401 TaxID=167551 RepID=A0A0A2B8W2_PROMR|nr:hypothetical protein [Prochlorococcus marinus]KGG02846.1 hypothetical protein EU99_1808 [Prochlorococcus marinus str. MIT 9321]KGG05469.1 hypothetical protein EV00_1103 [Prochlorococcus marinus str. MIT 9322]KGG10503.1 hypothetical protein EV01_0131 [Prochlorococcus marinus str. MIT 9401]
MGLPKRKLIIHLGLHKTGTTFLQNRFFPRMGNITFLGKSNSSQYASILNFNNYVMYSNDLDFEPEKSLKLLEETIKFHNFKNNKKNNIYLISEEGFSSGTDWFGSTALQVPKRLHNSLKDYFDLYFIITTRNRYDLYASIYTEYIKRGGIENIDLFIKTKKGISLLSRLRFNKYIKEIKKFEKVIKVDCEKFFKNESFFKKELETFIDTKLELLPIDNSLNKIYFAKNISPSLVSIVFLRKFNIFWRGSLSPIKRNNFFEIFLLFIFENFFRFRIYKLIGLNYPKIFLKNYRKFSLDEKKYFISNTIRDRIIYNIFQPLDSLLRLKKFFPLKLTKIVNDNINRIELDDNFL